jgi:tyrosyl-tRNA synthetase
MKELSFNFADVGKRITVNYMMAKDSVKKRLAEGEGMSFTVYVPINSRLRFYHLHKGIQLPVANGGFRPMGNITTGTELVRRMNEGKRLKLMQ